MNDLDNKVLAFILNSQVLTELPPIEKWLLHISDIDRYMKSISNNEVQLLLTQSNMVLCLPSKHEPKCFYLQDFIDTCFYSNLDETLQKYNDIDNILNDNNGTAINAVIDKDFFINSCTINLSTNYNLFVDTTWYLRNPIEDSDAQKILYSYQQIHILKQELSTGNIVSDNYSLITVFDDSTGIKCATASLRIKHGIPIMTIHNLISCNTINNIISVSKYLKLQNIDEFSLEHNGLDFKWSAHLDTNTGFRNSLFNSKLKQFISKEDITSLFATTS